MAMTGTGPTRAPQVPYKTEPLGTCSRSVPILRLWPDRPGGNRSVAQQQYPRAANQRLLASLTQVLLGLLSADMTVEQLSQGAIVIEAGEETENVYFPHSGSLSLLAVLKDGRTIKTATVGREGVVGAMAGLGLHISQVRVVVQLESEVTRISAVRFRKAVAESTVLRDICIDYNEILLSQARINVACSSLHVIEARFCRRLLQMADAARSDTINLTQQFFSETMGVRRTSVTEVARKLQDAGAIRYSRGELTIVKREILERLSCECYETLVDQLKRSLL